MEICKLQCIQNVAECKRVNQLYDDLDLFLDRTKNAVRNKVDLQTEETNT
jgi:hypothetical protein